MELQKEAADTANTFLPPQKDVTVFELWQYQKKKLALRQEYLDRWNDSVNVTGTGRPVDGLISPVSSWGAPPHGMNL